MVFTLGEAAKHTGKSKSAILKAIKTGRLSGTRSDTGEWQIDPAELMRVYPTEGVQVSDRKPHENGGLPVEFAVLQERCNQLENQIHDLRQDRDHWRQQATALLTDRREKAPVEAPGGRWSRAWSILRGKG